MIRKLVLGVIIMITLVTTTIAAAPILLLQQAYGYAIRWPDAGVAATGNNVYVIWASHAEIDVLTFM